MKILFITSNRLGDAVLSTGVLTQLVEHYPNARFTIVCGPYAAGLFRAVPRLERLIMLQKQRLNFHWLSLWSDCVATRWNLIVDLRNSLITRLLFADKRLYRGRHRGQHKVIENARVIQIAQPPAPHIWLDTQAEQEAAHLLPSARPLLALGPAANWPPKQWPVERFVALAQKLTAEDGPLPKASVLVIASESENEIVQPFRQALPAGKCIPIIGHGLLTIAACLKECALYIGNDSGLMHLAAAIHIPVLGLFGPGEKDVYGPWGGHVVHTPESREELLGRLSSPAAVSPNLMGGLDVEKVYQAAGELLEKSNS